MRALSWALQQNLYDRHESNFALKRSSVNVTAERFGKLGLGEEENEIGGGVCCNGAQHGKHTQ